MSNNTFSLEEVIKGAKGKLIAGNAQGFAGISIDSRTIKKGELFIPLIGERFDGHNFIKDALKKGAKGSFVQQYYFNYKDIINQFPYAVIIEVEDTLKAMGDLASFIRHKYKIMLLAVAGSNGKTTTKEMIANILSLKVNILKSEGNFNNLIGLPLTLFKLNPSHEIAVVELGMNLPGELYRLTEIADPDIGLMLNIRPAHLEMLGSFEDVVEAKADFFRAMREDAKIIINNDDENIVKVTKDFKGDKITFGIDNSSDFMAKDIEYLGLSGVSFVLVTPIEERKVKVSSFGLGTVYNSIAAASASYLLGIDIDTIVKGIENFSPYKMRMNLLRLQKGIFVLDDTYNANPSSMEMSLMTFSQLKGKNRGIAILGDMLELGEIAHISHEELGSKIKRYGIEYLFYIGEFGEDVKRGAIQFGMDPSHIFLFDLNTDISWDLLSILREGDWVLLKASRRMNLNRWVDWLLLKFGPQIEIQKENNGS
ncbi:MAG: UDP-N-acetylmuramoyl-tripeptide--D-alanyl-D-alanine ligase [Deltaproteobacteria bacterium]|nr:UDP-N-acetylmuramoyl-tripeptide--D-alanyl-D-alanine ligase [Deltaproteobacteria bacterium]